MQSIRLLAGVTAVLILGSACGGDGGNGPGENRAPVAAFSEVCTPLNCVFTDASTDPDGAETITTRSWTFGDGTTGTGASVTHPYAAPGTFAVGLTVTDNGGLTNVFSKNVVVTGAPDPGNTPPTASFNTSCDDAGNCTFTSTSSDATPGAITAYAWTFGDGATATEQNPIHDYAAVAAPTDFTVTLTVTDNNGATDDASQVVRVSPPSAELCQTAGKLVTCTLDVAQRSTVKLTITEVLCELTGNRLEVELPRRQTAFANLCVRTVGEEYTVSALGGAPLVIEAGNDLVLKFTQGTGDPEDPPLGSPAVRIEGSYPTWTLKFDDGGNPTGAGEPDFTDVVFLVQATSAP